MSISQVQSPTQNLPDPNDPVEQAIKAWNDFMTQQEAADKKNLVDALQRMITLCKEGHQDLAYATAQQGVLPSVTALRGEDPMGELAASMNISSAIQNEIAQMQEDLNGGKDITDAQAKDFADKLKNLYDEVQTQTGLPAGQGWMDPATAANLCKAFNDTAKNFNSSATADSLADPTGKGVDEIKIDTAYWNDNPTQDDDGYDHATDKKSGQQHIQSLQAVQAQSNNSVAAQSQSLNAQLQFASGTYTQYLDTSKNIYQSTQSFVNNIVQNLGKQ